MICKVFGLLTGTTVGLDSFNITLTKHDTCNVVSCPSGLTRCDIYCYGSWSCANILINCSDVVSCSLQCYNKNSCSKSIAHGLETQNLDVFLWANATSTAAASTASNISIICPIGGNSEASPQCTTHCNHGKTIFTKCCFDLMIYSQQGS